MPGDGGGLEIQRPRVYDALLPLSGFVRQQFNSSTTLVNNQLVCLLRVKVLNYFFWNVIRGPISLQLRTMTEGK